MNKSELKIAIIVPSLANMGPVSVARDIVSGIVNKVKYIKVFYFDDIVGPDFDCDVEQISFLHKVDFSNFDVVHTHGLRPDLYLTIHRISGIKRITTLHSNLYEDLRMSHGKVKGYFFAKVWLQLLSHDKVVVLSDLVKKFYSNKIRNSKERLLRIYNGRNLELKVDGTIEKVQIEKIESLKNNTEIIIASISVLNARKGIDQIIRALENNNVGALIIGDGPERQNLESLAKELKVDDRVLFLGYQSNPYKYYKYFDVFTLTSYSEGFPLSLLEAIQMQKPCVVSNLPIYKEMFIEGKEILKYELNNISDLVDKIKKCKKDEDILIVNAAKRVHENYTVEIMANNYLKLYYEQ
ncbi:MAG: glycosyltransferase family 4 protein [Flavobacteriales bacterium]|nr:glycosyltransferase family 4 protein [Flavobacteriales bacterium]